MESFKDDMTTLSQVMETLRQRGIDTEFRMDENNQMISSSSKQVYQPDDLLIIRTFRFEGMSDPDDNAILYLVEDQDKNKGFIIDAYGAYSNQNAVQYNDFIKKIPVDERDDQEIFR